MSAGRILLTIDEHGELAQMIETVLDVVARPERVLAGAAGEMLAIREVQADKWLVVVHKEEAADGFIITAFLTRRTASLKRRQQLWP